MFVSTTRTLRTWCLDRQTRFLQSLQGGFALFGRCCCCCYCWTWFLQSLQGGFPSLILVVDKPPRLTKVPDCTFCQIRCKKQIVRRWHCLSCCYCCRRVACVVSHFIGPRVDHIAFGYLSDINSLLCGWSKSDDGYGDGGGEDDIICFLPITGSSRSSTQPYGKSGRMEGTTIFLWERLRLQ